MGIKIFNDKMHKLALDIIDDLMDAKPNTPQCELLDVLATAVVEYETIHYPTG